MPAPSRRQRPTRHERYSRRQSPSTTRRRVCGRIEFHRRYARPCRDRARIPEHPSALHPIILTGRGGSSGRLTWQAENTPNPPSRRGFPHRESLTARSVSSLAELSFLGHGIGGPFDTFAEREAHEAFDPNRHTGRLARLIEQFRDLGLLIDHKYLLEQH